MNEALLARLLMELGLQALLVYRQYKVTGKLELTAAMRKQLELISREEGIVTMYGTSREEIDRLLAEHETS